MRRDEEKSLLWRERRRTGLTRRTMAERLGVPKSVYVSWEKGIAKPSLKMLYLISEILDVSPEEIMRGRRIEGSVGSNLSADRSRSARRLMVQSLSLFRRKSFTCIGIAVFGIFLGLIANLVFRNAWLSYIINMAATTLGCVLEAFALRDAYRSIDTDSLEMKHVALYKASVLQLGMAAYLVASVFFGWSMPLVIYVREWGKGLSATRSFMLGTLYSGIFFAVGFAVCFVLHAKLIKWGKIPLSERDKRIYCHNHRLLWILIVSFAVLFSLSLWVERMLIEPDRLMERTEFWNLDDFRAYMQKDLRYPYDGSRERDMKVFYCDRHGNPISEDQALMTVLRDARGNVLTAYLDRNRNVYDISTSTGPDEPFPITVLTYTGMRHAREKEVTIHTVFALLYASEMFFCIMLYLMRRKEH